MNPKHSKAIQMKSRSDDTQVAVDFNARNQIGDMPGRGATDEALSTRQGELGFKRRSATDRLFRFFRGLKPTTTGTLSLRDSFVMGLFAGLWFLNGSSSFAQQTNHPNPRDFSAFQIINDRNIFDPSRRPRVQQSQRSTPRPQQIVDTFSLVGTMSYSNLLLAFFDGSSSDYRKSLGVDGKIANYTLAEIRHDAVKLVSGTNEIELKVGMHMRRSEDGHWSASEAASGAFNSYVSSSSRSSNRNDRRSYRGGNNGGGAAPSQTSSDSNTQSEMPVPPDGAAGPGPDAANLDPNDPVARMMLRRLQEEGGGASVPQPSNNQPSNNAPAEQPATEPSDSNAAGTPPANDNQNPPPEPPQP